MACPGRCFSTPDGVHGRPVAHHQQSQLGLTWYFCPAHTTFHSFFLREASPQPLCGDCAVLFFDRAHYAVWIRPYDVSALLSNSVQIYSQARADMEAMLLELEQLRADGRAPATATDPLAPPDALCPDVLKEIPKHDSTYAGLGDTLIPHARFSGMFLLQYRTFQGALAYQPCSKDMDVLGTLDALRPIDQHGDPVFRQARTWSCIVQAAQGLPRELRWVLATMYNFCNEMLCPHVQEETLWNMRPWLLHWYGVAEELLGLFGIFAGTPDIDWFARPRATTREAPSLLDDGPEVANVYRSRSPSSSLCETVVRHCLKFGDEGNTNDGPQLPSHDGKASLIHSWLLSQPLSWDVDRPTMFDPTPRGFVSPKTRRSTSTDCSAPPPPSVSRLDPCAAAFYPSAAPRSVTTESSAESDDRHDAADEDSGSDTDGCVCSCPPASDHHRLRHGLVS